MADDEWCRQTMVQVLDENDNLKRDNGALKVLVEELRDRIAVLEPLLDLEREQSRYMHIAVLEHSDCDCQETTGQECQCRGRMQAVRALLECKEQCKILKDSNESLRKELERSNKAETTAKMVLKTVNQQLQATRTQLDELDLVHRDLQRAFKSTENLNQKNQERLLTQREQFKALEMQNAQVLQAKTDEHNRQAKTRDLWEKERADLCRKISELEADNMTRACKWLKHCRRIARKFCLAACWQAWKTCSKITKLERVNDKVAAFQVCKQDQKTAANMLGDYFEVWSVVLSFNRLKNTMDTAVRARASRILQLEEQLSVFNTWVTPAMLAAIQHMVEADRERANACALCEDSAALTALVPCGHCFCSTCALTLQVCPTCQEPVKATQKLFQG